MPPPTSRSPTPPSTKRLLHELRAQSQDPAPFLLFLRPVSESQILTWEAVMKGPPGTAYEEGLWHLHILLPQTYPLHPPTITFTTPVCHPNISFRTGEICLDLLKASWTPAYTVARCLEAVRQLLAEPVAESPLNVDVAALVRGGDAVGAEGLVRFWCGERRWVGGGGVN